MAIQTSRQLAISFRERAVTCENVASEDARSEHRAVLLRTAERYRMLADKIHEPGAKWEAFMKSFGLTP